MKRVLAISLLLPLLLAAAPRDDMRRAINQERAERGCSRLTDAGPQPVHTARVHSRDMAEAGYIFHSVLSIGHWNRVGEVVGVSDHWRYIFEALMASPDHRHLMMDCRYDKVAIGLYRDEAVWMTGRLYAL